MGERLAWAKPGAISSNCPYAWLLIQKAFSPQAQKAKMANKAHSGTETL